MDEYIFTFSPAIADQGTLEAQLHSKNAKNLVITPTTDEQGETEFRIWSFEGGENIHNIKAGLAGYFLAVGEEGLVTVKMKNQSDQLWQFDSHESGLRGLNTDADQIVGGISGRTDIDDLDVATVPQDPPPEEVSLIFSPATADELALKAALDNHNVNLYTVSSNDVDDETEFRIDLWEDELQAARGALAEFYSNMGGEGFVEVRYASGRTEEWEFNDELDVVAVPQDPPPEEVKYASGKVEQREFDEDLDVATVPQDPLPEEVSLIFSPATADELALKAALDNHNVNLYTVSSNDVDDETEFRIDLWEDELQAARGALAEFFVSKIGCYGFVEVRYASGRTEEWEFNDELDVVAVPQDPPPEEVSLIFSPATADELALKNSLDDHNVNLYTISSNNVDDETEFRIDLREDELLAARGALAEFFVSKIGCYGFVEVKYASGKAEEWEFD